MKTTKLKENIEALFQNKSWVSCFIDRSAQTVDVWKDIVGLSLSLRARYDVELWNDYGDYGLFELSEDELNEFKDAGYSINIICGQPIVESI